MSIPGIIIAILLGLVLVLVIRKAFMSYDKKKPNQEIWDYLDNLDKEKK